MLTLAALLTIALALLAVAGLARLFLCNDSILGQLLGGVFFVQAAEAVFNLAGEVLCSILSEMGK